MLEEVNPTGTILVTYAEDLAILTTAKTRDILENRTALAVIETKKVLYDLNIQIAVNKTELILLNGRRKITNLIINIDDPIIYSKNALKYMGIYIDKDLKFNSHIRNTTAKTKSILNQLTRLTPRTTGPTYLTRRVIMSAATSALMYTAPIRGSIVQYKYYQQMIDRSFRQMALCITRAYRTTPTQAILLIAKIPPVKLQVEEKLQVFRNCKTYKTTAETK